MQVIHVKLKLSERYFIYMKELVLVEQLTYHIPSVGPSIEMNIEAAIVDLFCLT
jgi:hypothetical protein